jgi:hypothetical protein
MGVSLQLQNGALYLEEYQSDGSLGAKVPFGTTDTISFNTSLDKIEHYDTEEEEQVRDGEDVTKRNITLAVTTNDITAEMLERAHLASTTDLTQTAQTDTAVVIAAANHGEVNELGYMDITAITVKDSTDTTTYVEGTDYTYDRKWGTLIALSTGSIVDEAEVHVTLSANAITSGKTLTAFAVDKKEYRMTFQGRSSKGINEKHVFEKVSLALEGDRTLKTGESQYTSLSFTGAALKHNGKYHTITTF